MCAKRVNEPSAAGDIAVRPASARGVGRVRYAPSVSPYRSPPAILERHEIGSRRAFRLQVALGLALLCIPAILIALWTRTGGGIGGSIFLPAIFGGVLIARARYSSIEASTSEREVRVLVRRLGPALRVRIPFDELESVRVLPTNFKSQNPTYELQIGRVGGQSVVLMRADGPSSLEAERERLGRFLIEAGAMNGLRTRVSEPDRSYLPRIEQASEGDPVHEPAEPVDHLDDRNNRGRS